MHLHILVSCLVTVGLSRPQVNSEIFSEDDLLAIDSGIQATRVPGPQAVLSRPQQSSRFPANSAAAGPSGGLGLAAGGGVSLAAAPPRFSLPTQAARFPGNGNTLSFRNTMQDDGSYAFGYETSDGTTREEEGKMTPGTGMAVTGSWSYIGGDGVARTVVYTADHNGFRPRIIKSSEVRKSRSLAKPNPQEKGLETHRRGHVYGQRRRY